MAANKKKKKKNQKTKNEKKKQKKVEKKKKRRAKAQALAKERMPISGDYPDWDNHFGPSGFAPRDEEFLRREAYGHNDPPSRANFKYAVCFVGPAEHLAACTININGKSNLDEIYSLVTEAFHLPQTDEYKFSPFESHFIFVPQDQFECLDEPFMGCTQQTYIGSLHPTEQKRIKFLIEPLDNCFLRFELLLIEKDETSAPLKSPTIERTVGQLDLEDIAQRLKDHSEEDEAPLARPDFAMVTKEATPVPKELGEQPIDYLFDGRPKNEDDIEYLLHLFVQLVDNEHFLLWEAELCRRQGLPLSKRQLERLERALYFLQKDEALDYMLSGGSLDENYPSSGRLVRDENNWPCPQRPWYDYAKELVDKVLVDTLTVNSPVYHHLFAQPLCEAIIGMSDYLSVPEEVEDPLEIVPIEKIVRLQFQGCLTPLIDALCVVEYEDSSVTEITTLVETTFDRLIDATLIQNIEWITFNKIVEMVKMPKLVKDIFTKVAKEQFNLKSGNETLRELFAINLG